MFLKEKNQKAAVKQEKYTCSCGYSFKGKAGIEYVCKECGQDVLPKGSNKIANKYKITKM